ncbi:MAG: hypothetical protein HYY06_30930 [Deltaproteobacteria bacterium]|nr:hypothetical protein [Deltaproteobacteria bacterium]
MTTCVARRSLSLVPGLVLAGCLGSEAELEETAAAAHEDAPCEGPGACWFDRRTVDVGAGLSAPGRTGQWWCDNHFGGNLGGSWECIAGTDSSCEEQAPRGTRIHCGRLGEDGTTPFVPSPNRTKSPFGYGEVRHVLVRQPAEGRTGQWWCDNHFGGNLGGRWKCRGVSGGASCAATAPGGEMVSCSRYADVRTVEAYASAPGQTGEWWCDAHFGRNLGGSWDCIRAGAAGCGSDVPVGVRVTCGRAGVVDETGFEPVGCDHPTLDGAEREFCNYTEYMTTRKARAMYLYNDWLRAGFNRSFGGALFELYGVDKRNRIEEHGGAAVQLSIWGYDPASEGAAFFTTASCDTTPYADAASCRARNGGAECRRFPASGGQISCSGEPPCLDWSAGAPWNPIQAQAAGCGWDGPTNDVAVTADDDSVTLTERDPWQFTKATALTGTTWRTKGRVRIDRPYLEIEYRITYDSARAVGEHDQEIPAIFTDRSVDHWHYYYAGDSPYHDAHGPVTRRRSDFGIRLALPDREAPLPSGRKTDATEEWSTVCDRRGTRCLTVASFSPRVKALSLGGQYVTALGRFSLGRSFDSRIRVYLFPYRFDEIVAGRTVREWIYQIRAER